MNSDTDNLNAVSGNTESNSLANGDIKSPDETERAGLRNKE
ncbi:hypothetical protein [Methanosarcina siciliae]|nr:hypothetical protein [Methanosarcina siciliae]